MTRLERMIKNMVLKKGMSDSEIDMELSLVGVETCMQEIGRIRRKLGLKANIKRNVSGFHQIEKRKTVTVKIEATQKPLVRHENKAGICMVTVVDKNALESELQAKYGKLLEPVKCAIGECRQNGLFKFGRSMHGYDVWGQG